MRQDDIMRKFMSVTSWTPGRKQRSNGAEAILKI